MSVSMLDERLRTDVLRELARDPRITHAGAITVSVKDGVVTLDGTVGSHSERWFAEHAARRVADVKAVIKQLHVGRIAPAAASHAELSQPATESSPS